MAPSLNRLPWYGQLAAFVAIAIAATAVFYYVKAKPAMEEIAAKMNQLAALKADIQKGSLTARKLPEFQREVATLHARLDSLRQSLPEQKDVADLLRKIQMLATQSNLAIRAFKPAATKTKQYYAEWPIELDLDGTYHSLGGFFDKIGNFSRIINVSDVKIRSKEKPTLSSTISATCTATTFVFLETPAPAGPAPGVAQPAAQKPSGAGK